MWKNAHQSDPVKFSLDGNGWRTDNHKIEFVWYEGEQSPSKIFVEAGEAVNILGDEESDEENELQEYNLSSDEDDLT